MFKGVAIRYDVTDHATPSAEITLIHRDPALHLPLSRGGDTADLSADWQAWAKLFGLPLLVQDKAGDLRPAKSYLGKLAVATSLDRRHHAQFAERRPRFLTRRKTGAKSAREMFAGREIIARN